MKFTEQQWSEIAATLRPPETPRDRQLVEAAWQRYLEDRLPRSAAVLHKEWCRAELWARRGLTVLGDLHPAEPDFVEAVKRFRQKAENTAETYRMMAMDAKEMRTRNPDRDDLLEELTSFWIERGGHLRRRRPTMDYDAVQGDVVDFLRAAGEAILGTPLTPEAIDKFLAKRWY